MPDAEVARMEPATCKCLCSRSRVLVVALGDIIAMHHDLAYGHPIAGNIVHSLIDDTHRVCNHIVLTLSGKQACLFRERKTIPFLVPFTNGVGAIGLGQAIDMNGT